jgi:hypothetical protein
LREWLSSLKNEYAGWTTLSKLAMVIAAVITSQVGVAEGIAIDGEGA